MPSNLTACDFCGNSFLEKCFWDVTKGGEEDGKNLKKIIFYRKVLNKTNKILSTFKPPEQDRFHFDAVTPYFFLLFILKMILFSYDRDSIHYLCAFVKGGGNSYNALVISHLRSQFAHINKIQHWAFDDTCRAGIGKIKVIRFGEAYEPLLYLCITDFRRNQPDIWKI